MAWLGRPTRRMAFTNYLAQSVILGWIFYGYGLGLFNRLEAASALAIGLVVYAGQVVFSAWWLRRYRYGPVEWLWRTLMYGVSQPMLLLPRGQAASALIRTAKIVSSFRDGPKDQTRNLEIPGSRFQRAPE